MVVIPARGGSKGLPDKNIKMLFGKPLIHHTIEAALEVFDPDQTLVSTDSEQIKAVSEQTGIKVPFLRPAELATDTATTRDVLLHAAEWWMKTGKEVNTIICLQPTSPLRSGKQIKEAMNLYESNLDMVVSVHETDANPYYVLFEEDKSGFLKKSKESRATRRQDIPKVWQYNGAIYIINTDVLQEKHLHQFEKIKKYVMPIEDSMDIDTEFDLDICELILNKRTRSKK